MDENKISQAVSTEECKGGREAAGVIIISSAR